jgi:hypothetical protein
VSTGPLALALGAQHAVLDWVAERTFLTNSPSRCTCDFWHITSCWAASFVTGRHSVSWAYFRRNERHVRAVIRLLDPDGNGKGEHLQGLHFSLCGGVGIFFTFQDWRTWVRASQPKLQPHISNHENAEIALKWHSRRLWKMGDIWVGASQVKFTFTTALAQEQSNNRSIALPCSVRE